MDADPGNPERYVAFVAQWGLGLPDEAYCREEHHAEVREQYLTQASFELAGCL